MDRRKILEMFADYVEKYDSKDAKISLKIKHTYKVAGLCEKIGTALGLKGDELDAAWVCGMLHDIGRFEQIRQYGTFIDSKSVDHAKLGTVVLFGEERDSDGILEKLPLPCQLARVQEFANLKGYEDVIYTAIYWHSAYRLPKNLDDKTRMYCNILRDADKLDILRANLDTPLEDIYNVTTEELYHCQVTPEVMKAFDEHHAVPREVKKTPVDHIVGHVCLAYELVYPVSRQLVKEQGYLQQLLDFQSENTKTREQFSYMRQAMRREEGKDDQ